MQHIKRHKSLRASAELTERPGYIRNASSIRTNLPIHSMQVIGMRALDRAESLKAPMFIQRLPSLAAATMIRCASCAFLSTSGLRTQPAYPERSRKLLGLTVCEKSRENRAVAFEMLGARNLMVRLQAYVGCRANL